MSTLKKQYLAEHPEAIKYGKDNPMYGKTASETTKSKMSKSRKGNKNALGKHWTLTPEQVEQHRQIMLGNQYCLGRTLSEETKRKIAESNRNRVISDESRKKMSESHKGKTIKSVLCVETNIIYESITQAARDTNIGYSNISHCCRGAQKTAGGYHREFVN